MKLLVLLTLAFGVCTGVTARDIDATIDLDDQKVMSSRSFLEAHPDIKFRTEGWLAFEAADYQAALEHFRHAASYGDKLSQAMLAEMHWKGTGTPVDRAVAYVWADLAAERGYVQFVALRERYWEALGATERERALSTWRALLDVYGDATARPRMTAHLEHVTRRGSRPHRDADVVVADGRGGLVRVRGWDFYDEKFWDPARYQAWVDARWAPLPSGTVDVRALEVVGKDADGPPPAPEPTGD